MNRRTWAIGLAFVLGAAVGHWAIPSSSVVLAQSHKPLMITRVYTGPDNQTHAEEVELKFSPGNPNEVSKMLPVNGAELHRGAPGRVSDWHRGPRHQYVITLTGEGEIEVAGGKKIRSGPGHIELIEDTTGKGHITRVLGNEERVTLQLPIVDQPGR